jgi:hypothetical protein
MGDCTLDGYPTGRGISGFRACGRLHKGRNEWELRFLRNHHHSMRDATTWTNSRLSGQEFTRQTGVELFGKYHSRLATNLLATNLRNNQRNPSESHRRSAKNHDRYNISVLMRCAVRADRSPETPFSSLGRSRLSGQDLTR